MTFTKSIRLNLVLCFVVGLLVIGCDSDDPGDSGAGEEELITRVTLTFTPESGGAVVTASASDPDGDGTDFQIDTINLIANTTYAASVEVADDINNADVTAEIIEEADEHQLFYFPADGVMDRLLITYNDSDENGLPVGLNLIVAVSGTTPASGTLRVVLSHYDEGPKDGQTQSDESDVDLIFPVEVVVP